MNKEEFLKKLNVNLNHLTDEVKNEELAKYQNLNNYNLDPTEEANKIYKQRGLKIEITNKIKFLDAVAKIIEVTKSKDKKLLSNVLLFFLYLLIIIILIKLPFIYVRDICSSIFNTIFSNKIINIIWNLLFEILYAITAILLFIRLIKNKALEYEKNV